MRTALFAGALVATIAAACAPPAASERKGSKKESLERPGEEEAEFPPEIDIQPTNGKTFVGRTAGRDVSFSGFATTAGATIEVQVLSSPSAAIADANWVTVATTTASTTPTTFNDATPIFRWSLTAAPSADETRWPLGGLLRYRTIATDDKGRKTALPFFDESAAPCIQRVKNQSWKDVLKQCQSPWSPVIGGPITNQTRAAALVSVSRTPGNAGFTPPYLNRKGEVTQDDTAEYYEAINAPRTLDEYLDRYGFTNGGRDVESTFFNAGDLGIGREMHCTEFQEGGQDGLACYVSNYGVDEDGQPLFNGDPEAALEDAIRRENRFATVAMIKLGSTYADPEGNDVQFFVYDAAGNIANAAGLDSTAQNASIPNNCTNCHGGKYDTRTKKLIGATFLPFDPEAFLFAERAPLRFQDQEDAIRESNAMIAKAGAPPVATQLIKGFYGDNADRAGTTTNLDYIPKGWTDTEEAKTVYRKVYKPYCRTCHVSQIGDYAFLRYEDFKLEAQKSLESVCKTNQMPIAETTMEAFWTSPARAYLVNALGVSDACAPREAR